MIQAAVDDDLAARLDELMNQDWLERNGAFVRIIELRVLDEAAYQEAIERLSSLRPAFGRGLGRPRSR